MTIETMHRLPRSEKLKLMESLWEDLSRADAEFESPAWHKQVLVETEQRLATGQEEVLDWDAAKKTLRKHRTGIGSRLSFVLWRNRTALL